MAAPAHVTAADAPGAFRSRLIVFLATATRSLNEAHEEVRRTRQWIAHEQRMHWQSEIRRRQKRLDAATQELMAARLSSLRDSTAAQQAAVTKARAALHEAEEKLRRVIYWDRNFDLAVDPLVKSIGGLRSHLDQELPRGVALLAGAQRALDAYVEKIGARKAETAADPEETKPENSPS